MTDENVLPPFPVDDETLNMLSMALDPGPEADRTSVNEFLELMSQMGGSDTTAVAEVIHDDPRDEDPYESRGDQPNMGLEIHVMRDQQYHEHDVLRALIAEVRNLRDPAIATPREYAALRAMERLVHELAKLRTKLETGVMDLSPDEYGRVSKGLVLAIIRGEVD